MRDVLRKLTRSKDGCDIILSDDIEREKWTTFVFEKHKLSIPTDVMLGVIKELGESLEGEVKAVLAKFDAYGVDPCSAELDE